MDTYIVKFYFTDSNGHLQKGQTTVQADSINGAMAAARAEMSWKCDNMHSFTINKIS